MLNRLGKQKGKNKVTQVLPLRADRTFCVPPKLQGTTLPLDQGKPKDQPSCEPDIQKQF